MAETQPKQAVTRYGPRKLGEKEFARQQATKTLSSRGSTVYGPRKGGPTKAAEDKPAPSGPKVPLPPPAERSEAFAELVDGLYDNGVGWARQRILALESETEVRLTKELERRHPQYGGGRKGVLNALEERQGELASDDPSPGLARQPAADEDDEGAEGSDEAQDAEDAEPEAGDPSIADLETALEEEPSRLDDLIEAEFADGEPRPAAVQLFRRAEAAREGGPREKVIELLQAYEEG